MGLKQQAPKPVRIQHSFLGNELCVIAPPGASVGPLATELEACQFGMPDSSGVDDEIPREWRRRVEEWISHQLADCARRSRQAIFVMVYEAPATCLLRRIRSLADGLAPPEDLERFLKQSLDHWYACHLALLEQYREHGHEAVLISGDRSIETEALLSRIRRRFDERDPHTGDQISAAESTAINPYRDACIQVVDSLAPECLELYAEFESCAELMGRDPEFDFRGPQVRQAQTRDVLQLLLRQVCFEPILARYGLNPVDFAARLDAMHKRLQELAEVGEERIRKLAASQEETSRLREERNEGRKQYQQLSSKTAGIESEKKALQDENELLLLQLHQVHEELERYYLLHKNTEQQLGERQSHLERLTKERDEQAKLALDRKVETERLTKARDEQAKLAGDRQALLERLGKAKEELTRQLVEAREQIQSLSKASDEQARLAGERQAQLEARSASLWQRLGKSVAHRGDALPSWAVRDWFGESRKRKRLVKHHAQLIRQSGDFNEEWYLRQYPDVAQARDDPVEHYLSFGASEARNPSPEFDTRWYLESNPDVAAADMNPLLHYIEFGKSEGRQPRRYRT
ncbi:MAG: hypothetical protein OES26_07120 [Gammaproteobacteria bacterium]|nr:hypothetical protein [Gammaproteobacteria bacterium]